MHKNRFSNCTDFKALIHVNNVMCLFTFTYFVKRSSWKYIQITEPWERPLRNHGNALKQKLNWPWNGENTVTIKINREHRRKQRLKVRRMKCSMISKLEVLDSNSHNSIICWEKWRARDVLPLGPTKQVIRICNKC